MKPFIEDRTMTSAAQSMFAMLQYTNQNDLSLSEIMGYSSHAFRMNIHPVSVSPAGPTMFAPYELVSQNLKTLGVNTLTVTNVTPLSDKDLADTIRFIETRIDTGVPIISWDLFSPEFGLIYGYDHKQQLFYAKDAQKDSTIKYTELNDRSLNHLFFCGYYESVSKRIPIMLRDALKKIIEHADGNSPFASYEYWHGLAGFQAWSHAFKSRKIDSFGNAYNLAVIFDARQHAERFFTILLEKWTVSTPLDRQVMEKLTKAKEIYSKVVTYFSQLQELFPYPHGGEPNNLSNSLKAIELLQHAYEWEKNGIEVLKELAPLLEQYEDENYGSPFLIRKTFEFAGTEHHTDWENFKTDPEEQMYELLKRDESILSRITTLKLIAYETHPSQGDELISYIVARPVHFKPYNLPFDMKYYHTENDYACIRVKLKEKQQGYEALKDWMVKREIKQNDKALIIELVRPPQHGSTKEELEIYIPIHTR